MIDRSAETRRAVRAKAARAATVLEPEHADLFESLRALRAEIAREQGVPAYVIFHDRTLREMAAARPTDETSLAALHGVGASKLERFGDRFLELIRDHD